MLKSKYKNFSKFSKYLKNQKRLIVIFIIVMILASTLGMALPYFYSKRMIGITDNNFYNVLFASLLIILIITFHHIFWYLWEKLASILTNNIAKEIRKDLISKIINTQYYEIKYKTSGFYLERLNDDTLEVSSFLSNMLGTLVDTLTNCSFLVFIYILNYKVGLLFTLGILTLFIIDLFKIKLNLIYTEKLKLLNEKFSSKVNESIKGIKEIKGLGIKNEIIDMTLDISDNISNVQIKKDKINAILCRTKTYLQYIIESIIIIYCVGYLIPKGDIKVVSLLMILNYTGFMYDLVDYIANMKDHFEKSKYKANRLLEILNTEFIDKYGEDNSKQQDYSIKIKNLSYSYKDDANIKVLNNINLDINPNTISLFVGNSGSGKSTLFSLLTKALETENNKIFIGNKDINDFSEKELTKNICIVNQEPFFLRDTILNNLKIVNSNATKENIIKACKIANIYDDIDKFNQKFDTIITENGTNLSGGQKQRLSIARALLKNTNIILFDEPTSALDKDNQDIFFNTINKLKSQKTILIIAHKFDNVDIFDNIYEIKKGNLKKVK